MDDSTKVPDTKAYNFNKPGYAIFVLAGLVFMIASRDFNNGALFFSLALVFDPFDPNVPWKERPLYQKVWLIVHLLLAIALFSGFLISEINSK
ncbi:MAG: hypothetical protein SFW35_13590 [Chitinophagales bacterium]|nr:hypothetical protein [Chitinophagales bacterium]